MTFKLKPKGIILYSGGLDSLLAAKLLLDQGLDLIGLYFVLPFYSPEIDPQTLLASQLAEQIDLPLKYYFCGEEYLEMVKNPANGYGKNINPCLDCKIFFLQGAVKKMEEEQADFIATGEVVGQRPMSQLKHSLNHITKETNLSGKLLRPLSAKLLKPTFLEKKGSIDREKLLDISGRSRKKQIMLAKQMGINNYSSPGGGCLFTDKNAAKIIKDLFQFHSNSNSLDLFLLGQGRNFRITEKAKIIIGRNEKENQELERYLGKSDYFFRPKFKGPSGFIKGEINDDNISLIAKLIFRYGNNFGRNGEIDLFKQGSFWKEVKVNKPLEDSDLDKMRI